MSNYFILLLIAPTIISPLLTYLACLKRPVALRWITAVLSPVIIAMAIYWYELWTSYLIGTHLPQFYFSENMSWIGICMMPIAFSLLLSLLTILLTHLFQGFSKRSLISPK